MFAFDVTAIYCGILQTRDATEKLRLSVAEKSGAGHRVHSCPAPHNDLATAPTRTRKTASRPASSIPPDRLKSSPSGRIENVGNAR